MRRRIGDLADFWLECIRQWESETEPTLTRSHRIDALLAEHDPRSMSAVEFRGARYDAGLAWLQFPVGFGELTFLDPLDDNPFNGRMVTAIAASADSMFWEEVSTARATARALVVREEPTLGARLAAAGSGGTARVREALAWWRRTHWTTNVYPAGTEIAVLVEDEDVGARQDRLDGGRDRHCVSPFQAC